MGIDIGRPEFARIEIFMISEQPLNGINFAAMLRDERQATVS